MVVVVIIATGATMVLKAYNSMKGIPAREAVLEQVLFSVQQQAAVMAALCATVFAVITALRTGKAVAMPGAAAPASPLFGTKTAASALAAVPT